MAVIADVVSNQKANITKKSMAEIIRRSVSRVWPARSSRVGPMPYDQKYAVVAVGLVAGTTPADHDTLVAAVEKIVGVQKAVITAYGISPSEGEVPVNHDVYVNVETSIKLRDTTPASEPEEPEIP